MEDFLKEKLDQFQENFDNDWPEFEQKLERALFFSRLRTGALFVAFLIIMGIGFFGTSSFWSSKITDASQRGTLPQMQHDSNKEVYPNMIPTRTGLLKSREFLPEAGEPENDIPKKDKIKTVIINENNVGGKLPEVNAKRTAEVKEDRGVLTQTSATKTKAGNERDMASIENKLRPSQALVELSGKEPGDHPAVTSKGVASNSKTNTLAGALSAIVSGADFQGLKVRMPIIPIKPSTAKPLPYVSPFQPQNPWGYSIKVYPNFTYRKFIVEDDEANLIHRDFIDQVQTSESGGFSLNIGLEVSKRVGRITYINTGIEYISYKTQANFDFTNYREANINDETGKIMNYSIKENPELIVISDINTYHYLNFPVSISYKPWVTDHIRVNIESGFSYMYFVTASGKTIDYQTLEVIELSEREYRNSMASFSMKVGATYHISRQFSMGFEPTLMYFTNTIYTEDYPFEVIPYSVGLNLKLQMKLN